MNANWGIWRVTDFLGLVSDAATMQRLSPDGFTVDTTHAGDVNVQVQRRVGGRFSTARAA